MGLQVKLVHLGVHCTPKRGMAELQPDRSDASWPSDWKS